MANKEIKDFTEAMSNNDNDEFLFQLQSAGEYRKIKKSNLIKVSSVNTQTGAVVLDADDIDDTSTTNKFVTSADITKLSNTSGTNTGDQDLSGYLLSSTASSTYEPLKGADDNYVTDAEKIVISNTSGTNTGDQTLPTRASLGLDTDDTVTFANLSGTNTGDQDLSGKQDNITLTTTGTSGAATLVGATLNIPQYTAGGGGDVAKVGTPVDNQVGVWTGDGTIEGTSGLTYNGSVLGVAGDLHVTTSGDCLVLNQTGGTTNNFFAFQSSGTEVAFMDGARMGLMRGTAANPSYTFMAGAAYDTDTGMFSPGANIIGFSTAGVERFRILADGTLAFYGNLTTTGTIDGIDIATDVAANTAKVGVTTQISNVVEDTTPQLGGNLSWNAKGMILEGVSPSGLSAGNLARFNGTNWVQADASASSTANGMIGVYVTTNTILTQGIYTTSGLTAGATYYMSETAGAITTTAPTTSTAIVRIIGYALSTTQLFVDPDKSYVEVV